MKKWFSVKIFLQGARLLLLPGMVLGVCALALTLIQVLLQLSLFKSQEGGQQALQYLY